MRAVFLPQDEERLKAEFFKASRTGYFVDVGANDPERESQTWGFEQAGWSGVLVEPQPDLADDLRRRRRAQVFAAACSSPENAGGTLRLYLSGMHSSLRPELAVAGVIPQGAIDVPARTLDDILEEAKAPAPIDFVSIDVEGHEVDVLKGFDLARWRPRLMMIEDHVENLAKHRYLTRMGYRLIRRTGLNAWYVPRSDAQHLPVYSFGFWQIARKYYFALPIRKLRDRVRRLNDRRRAKSRTP